MKTKLYSSLFICLSLLFPQQTLMAACGDFSLKIIEGDDNIQTENTVCSGNDIKIQVNNADDTCDLDAFDYEWSTGGTDSSIEIENIQGTTNDYTVTITDPTGDIETTVLTIEVMVVGPIKVVLELDDSTPPCEDQEIRLVATVTEGTGSVSYNWSSNIDEQGTGNMANTATDTPLNSGNINYTVSVVDNEGCSDIDSETVNIQSKPSISFPAGDMNYCIGEDISILASGGSNCMWTFPDGVTTQQQCELELFSVDETDSGEYTVEVTNSNGCVATRVADINVGNVEPTLSPTTTSVCEDDNTIALNPNPAGGTYMVNGNPNSSLIMQNRFRPGIAQPGEYEIKYTVTLGGCTGSVSTMITVKPLPEVNFGPNPVETVCAGDDPINLNNFVSPTGGQFFSGNTPIVNGQFDPADFSVGSRPLEYRIVEDGCTNSAFSSIDISAGPTVDTDPDRNICLGTETQLDADGRGGVGTYTYSWSPSTNLENPESKSPIVSSTLPSTTTFTVTVTDRGGEGCIATGTQTVTVYPQPTVEIKQSPEFICVGDSVILKAEISGGFGNRIYNWDGPVSGSNDSYPLNNVLSVTQVSVSVSFNNNAGCQTTTDDFTVFPQETPDPTIKTTSTTICSNQQSYFFVENRRSGSTFDWTWAADLVEEVDTIRNGAALLVRWKDSATGSTTIQVEENLNGACEGTASIEVNFSSGTAVSPDPAEIFLSPINNTLIYNDSSVDCYRWGYIDETIEFPGDENYQSYVTGQGYDPDRIYFCQVWNGDCNDPDGSCSTTIVYRSNEVDENPPQEQEEEFVLFPNPNSGAFTVQANKLLPNTEYEIRIVNALGQLIRREVVVTAEDKLRAEISLPNAGAGVHYMILYLQGDLKEVRPFVVHAK